MVYLLHFDQPYRHARHYIGYTNGKDGKDLDKRIERHRRGDGARIVRVIKEAGINFEVARVWPEGDRDLERRLKKWKKSWQLCPMCRGKNVPSITD